MTNDDTILREVDQALAADKASNQVQKNLPMLIAAGLLVVAGVGGWQFWSAQKEAAAKKASATYDEALRGAGGEEATTSLQSLAESGGGYGALARLRLAGGKAASAEGRAEALALYREVYEGGGGSKRLKDMARIKAGYLALADGRDAVIAVIGALETDASAIGFHAREILALAALKAGDYQSAEEMFRKAAAAPEAPDGVRLRAGEFLALAGAGKAGVALPAVQHSEKTQAERLMEALEEAGSDLSSVISGGDAEIVEDDAAPIIEETPTAPQAAPDGSPPAPQGPAPQGNE